MMLCALFSDVPGDRGHRDTIRRPGSAALEGDGSDRSLGEDADEGESGAARQPPHTAIPREDAADERAGADQGLPGDWLHRQAEHSRETREMVQLMFAFHWWRHLPPSLRWRHLSYFLVLLVNHNHERKCWTTYHFDV